MNDYDVNNRKITEGISKKSIIIIGIIIFFLFFFGYHVYLYYFKTDKENKVNNKIIKDDIDDSNVIKDSKFGNIMNYEITDDCSTPSMNEDSLSQTYHNDDDMLGYDGLRGFLASGYFGGGNNSGTYDKYHVLITSGVKDSSCSKIKISDISYDKDKINIAVEEYTDSNQKCNKGEYFPRVCVTFFPKDKTTSFEYINKEDLVIKDKSGNIYTDIQYRKMKK